MDACVGRGDADCKVNAAGSADQLRRPVGYSGLVLIRVDYRANAKDHVLLLAKFIQLRKHLQSCRAQPATYVFGQGLGGDTQGLHLVAPSLEVGPRGVEKYSGLLQLSVPAMQPQGETGGDCADAKRVWTGGQQCARHGEAGREQIQKRASVHHARTRDSRARAPPMSLRVLYLEKSNRSANKEKFDARKPVIASRKS